MRYLSVCSGIEQSGTPVVRQIDIARVKFGRLLAVASLPRRSSSGEVIWSCLCDCGTATEVPSWRLRGGHTKSCGCYKRSRIGDLTRKHGKSKTATYGMFYDARKRAAKFGLPFDIEPEDIVISEYCPVLGIRLSASGPRDNRPSLDRRIPSLGYTRTNVLVISFRANRIKADATPEELERVFAYARSSCAT
jgi:hypothetical protein